MLRKPVRQRAHDMLGPRRECGQASVTEQPETGGTQAINDFGNVGYNAVE
jgi:hypothetical protein